MSDNTLLVKLSSMGDVVHSFPAISEAAKNGHRFDWVVEEAFVELAAMHPAVDRVIPFGLRRWRRRPLAGSLELVKFVRQLRTRRYSNVLDAQGLLKSAFVSRVCNAATRTGFDAASARESLSARSYTSTVSVGWELHAIDRLRVLFAGAFDYSVDLSSPAPAAFLSSAESAAPKRCEHTVLIHGTTWPSKEYPEAAWSALIDALLAAGHSLLLLSGSDAEHQRAQRLCANRTSVIATDLSARSATVQAPPPGPLSAAAAQVLAARLVIGVDSGLTHLAAVLGRPTIGLYGSTSAARTGVRGPRAMDIASDFECAPCLQRECTYGGPAELLNGQSLEPACFSRVTIQRILELTKQLAVSL